MTVNLKELAFGNGFLRPVISRARSGACTLFVATEKVSTTSCRLAHGTLAKTAIAPPAPLIGQLEVQVSA